MQARESGKDRKGKTLDRLRELNAAFDLVECTVVRSRSHLAQPPLLERMRRV
jgi:hypothetical protein